MDQVLTQADALIGGHQDRCLMMDESCFEQKGVESAALRGNGVGDLGRLIIAKSEFLQR